MNIIEKNIEKIRDLCIRYKVDTLFVFGSVVTNRFDNNSDIDLLVDFGKVDLYEYADNYFDLKSSLENIFSRKVDLLETKALKNPYLKSSIDASKQLVYG